jgi:hypothetical protein
MATKKVGDADKMFLFIACLQFALLCFFIYKIGVAVLVILTQTMLVLTCPWLVLRS